MTEAQLQASIVHLARTLGWLAYHTHDSRRSEAGYPDLTLVRERVVFAELKSAKGRLRPEQVVWLERLDAAGAEAYVWKPADWPERIHAVLRPAASQKR